MWWSGNDQDWADNRLTRTVAVPAGSDVRFSMWNDYVIEEDWDFGFVEVSTDGGNTWTEQKVYNAAGEEVTTPDGYGDPNGRMADFGNKKYGLTGHTDGMEAAAHRPHAVRRHDHPGPPAVRDRRGLRRARLVRRRLRGHQRTAPTRLDRRRRGRRERLDRHDRHLRSGHAARRGGWRIDTGTSTSNQYYLAEWRNFDGFDEGLKYAYDTTYPDDGPWKVEKIKYNAPGMLVWYRDTVVRRPEPGRGNHL